MILGSFCILEAMFSTCFQHPELSVGAAIEIEKKNAFCPWLAIRTHNATSFQ